MKELRIILDDGEYDRLKRVKDRLKKTWKDFLIWGAYRKNGKKI